MAIKRRKIKVRAKPKKQTPAELLARMGDILAAGHGDEAMARTYFHALYSDQLARLQSIATRAEADRNWDFMEGCVKQASELYVLAAVLYEKYPEHTILTDGAYDGLSRWLLKHRRSDEIDKDFWRWYNITALDLKAATGTNVTARPPIKWMVYILTGEDMGADNETPPNRTRVLRRKSKRGSVAKPSGDGAKRSGPKRRRKRST